MAQNLTRSRPAQARQPLRASVLLVPLLVLGASQVIDVTSTVDVTDPAWSAATTVLVIGMAAAYTAGAMVAAGQRPPVPTPLSPRRQIEEALGIAARVDRLAGDPRQARPPAADLDGGTQPYDGPGDLDPRPVDLGDLVRRTVGRSRCQAQAAGVGLSVVILQEPPVLADPDRLAQALSEVTAHAIGRTPGGGHVRVTVTAVDGVAHVQITYPGADPSIDPSAVTGDQVLATARRLAEDHAGTLSVDPLGDRGGTTVCLRLPVLPPARDPGETG